MRSTGGRANCSGRAPRSGPPAPPFSSASPPGATGTAELLLVPGIRARAPAWTHFVIAVLLLSLLGLNWGYRMQGYEAAVLPYGILLSGFNVLVVMVTGWHGGKLVFDYRLGTSKGSG